MAACLLWISADHLAFAEQTSAASPAPQIIASGDAEILLPPERASFSIGILTSAQTAAMAGEDNARVSKDVLAALEHAGVKREDITGSRLGVAAHWEYDDKNRQPRRSGFDAKNAIQISTVNLTRIGNYIDAALSAGATDVSDIIFSAKDIAEARRRALDQAVVAARSDADAMARAAGGALGDLMLLSTERVNSEPGVRMEEITVTAARQVRGPVNTTIIPNQIKITARVIARWNFVPAAATK
jgi:uncharacterized protein YggE